MAQYLLEVAYTPESWAKQVRDQANVLDRIEPLVDSCGGRIESLFYAFGDYDLVGIADFSTPEGAAAFSLAATAGGAVKSFRTTPLLTIDQGISAMARAHESASLYQPPVDSPARQA
ncbi:GYD domain-containing protein [Nocardioides ungokensis]|uniref:GYD domain-containing protein n=1 Tax=Nocardioides ungokensis TaxID=1643322 RepID=UPI0015DF090F|nr:GYD domain-containing protein [Nocardioides ungokensis]